jgi:hypothetical protein
MVCNVLLLGAVMKACRCTAADVEIDCRSWFRTAADRKGGRKKRAEKKNTPATDISADNIETEQD